MCLFVIHWSRLVSEHTLTPRSASCETSRSGQLQRRPALLAQLSFSRSELRVCLQALSVSAFERVPGDVYFLLPPSIRPSLLVFCRYSSPYAPLVAHDPHQQRLRQRVDPESTPAQLTDSDFAQLELAHLLTACPFVLSSIIQPTFSNLLSLFRSFAQGIIVSTLHPKYHRLLVVVAGAGERGSRARNWSRSSFGVRVLI